jgi:hypothetical protein
MTGRAALTPLSLTYGFNVIETGSGLRFSSVGTEANFALATDDILEDLSTSIERIKETPENRLRDARLYFIDAGNDYQLGLATARDRAAETVRILDVDAPLVMDRAFAKLIADRLLARALQSDSVVSFGLAATRLDLEVGSQRCQIQGQHPKLRSRQGGPLSPSFSLSIYRAIITAH